MCCLLRHRKFEQDFLFDNSVEKYEFLYADKLLEYNKQKLVKDLKKTIEACVIVNAPIISKGHPHITNILNLVNGKPTKYLC